MALNKIKELLGEEPPVKHDYKERLNEEQIKAVETTEGSVLIIAGAGSGKTTTLIDRTAHIINKGCPAERILMLTFTNKAANEMKERGEKLLDARFKGVVACTYHSFCANILRKTSQYIGINNNFTIADPGDISDLISLLRGTMGYSKLKGFPKSKELVTMFSAEVNRCEKLESIIENEYPQFEGFLEEIIKLRDAFIAYKKEKSIYDYDDLLTYMNILFKKCPKIGETIADRFLYIMVDEYQDSNIPQLEFLRHMRSFKHKNICAVGDDQQSIYLFRGSQFQNILNFPKHFAPCEVIILDKNYRSNQEILDISNAVIERATQKFDKQLKGFRKKGELPKIVRVPDTYYEANWVVNEILRYIEEKNMPLSEIAVLSRGSTDSSEIEALLTKCSKKKNLPYKKYGGTKFLDRAVVKDIFAYLKVIVNPLDEIAWFHIFQLYPNIGPVYAKRLSDGISKNGIEELNDKKHKTKKYGEYLGHLYECYTKTKSMEFIDMLDAIINKYYKEIREKTIGLMNTTENGKKVAEIELNSDLEAAKILQDLGQHYTNPSKFLADLTLEAKGPNETKDAITISTVHSAKGLEFKVVFVLNCVEGTMPWVKPPKAETDAAYQRVADELEEERRVLYVALTRAKDDLYIMWPEFMIKFGQGYDGKLSRFLMEDAITDRYGRVKGHKYAEIIVEE